MIITIITKINTKGTCVSIDVAITGDRNLIKKDAVNNSKFEDPITEIQRTRNVRTKSDMVINGATGTISKHSRQYVSNIQGKHEIKELQKIAILCTAHILQDVLM